MYWNNDNYESLPLGDTSTGLSEPTVEYSNGFLHCSVVREAYTNFSTPTDPPKEVNFDLNNIPYYLLLARGGLSADGHLVRHSEKVKTKDTVSISDYGKIHPVYSGCTTTKGCFGYPRGCVETHSCSMLTSYAGISSDSYKFELYGKADSDVSSYAAVGISAAPGMGDASVVAW